MMTPRFSLSPRPAASGLACSSPWPMARSHRPRDTPPTLIGRTTRSMTRTCTPSTPGATAISPIKTASKAGRARRRPTSSRTSSTRVASARPTRRACRGRRGAGTPYYRAHRRFDPNNRPNNSEADRLFREKQEERDDQVFRGPEEVSGGRERAESAEAGPPHPGVRRRETARRAGFPEGPRTLGARAEVGGRFPGDRQSAGASTAAGCRTSPVLVARRSGSSEGDRPAGYGSASFVPSARPPGARRIAAGRADPLANPPRERVPGSLGPVADATPRPRLQPAPAPR